MSLMFDSISNLIISGVCTCVPENKIEIETYIDAFGEENVKKFQELTGVKRIRHCLSNETASDLGFNAAKALINKLNIDTESIGILVFLSQKPDNRFPATAYDLCGRLGLPDDVFCLDISLACSGFVYALNLTSRLLQTSSKNRALLITADTSHRTLNEEDKTVIMLFGDSGSAVSLEKASDAHSETMNFAFKTDGARASSIITPAGAFKNLDVVNQKFVWGDGILRSYYNTHMKGMAVFNFSITDVPLLFNDFFHYTNTTTSDYSSFAIHQANLYMLKQISRKAKIPFDKMLISIHEFGNNSSNSIPLLWCDHWGKEPAQSEEVRKKVFISGFGAGLSWACGSVNLLNAAILPIIELKSTNYEQERETS